MFLLLALFACGVPADSIDGSADTDAPESTSAAGDLYTFSWDGYLLTDAVTTESSDSELQLASLTQFEYAVGQLNHSRRGMPRFDAMELSVSSVALDDSTGLFRVDYSVAMPVLVDAVLPEDQKLYLPTNVSEAGVENLINLYTDSCMDPSNHGVRPDSAWYYYDPSLYSCSIADGETDEFQTIDLHMEKIAPSVTPTYPEYELIWEDDQFNALLLFGLTSGESESDPSVQALKNIVRELQSKYPGGALTEGLFDNDSEDVEFDITSPILPADTLTYSVDIDDDGDEDLRFVLKLMGHWDLTSESFLQSYSKLTTQSDYIGYFGHSGLGKNIKQINDNVGNAVERYRIIQLNGCDTFGYIGGDLFARQAEANVGDDDGTLFLDVIANAMPAYATYVDESALAVTTAIADYGYDEEPTSWYDILNNFSDSQVAVVVGDEDNDYQP